MPRRTSTTDRRRFLVAAAATVLSGPHRSSARPLHVLGTKATLPSSLRPAAATDLGRDLHWEEVGRAELTRRLLSRTGGADVYLFPSTMLDPAWRAGRLQAIDVSRLAHWGDFDLASIHGPDDALFTRHLEDDTAPADDPRRIRALPHLIGLDSFAHRAEATESSWGALFSRQLERRVAIANDPAACLGPLALAARAAELLEVENPARPRGSELDALFALLHEWKGQFRGIWSDTARLESALARDEVGLALPVPAIPTTRHDGLSVARPQEGLRGWVGVAALSSHLEPERQDAAYRFLDWWLGGRAGALLLRRGLGTTAPRSVRDVLGDELHAHLLEGAPLPGAEGVPPGLAAEGGWSALHAQVTFWDAPFTDPEDVLFRWRRFLTS